jgi:hypothetical protein
MPVWSGVGVPFGRMLGQVDQDDATNLPVGCGAVIKNTDFTRDATGSGFCWNTRAGNCAIMQGASSPGSGFWDFQYSPVSDSDPFFQMPLVFRMSGIFEREFPVGTGHMKTITPGLFSAPVGAHQINVQAGNKVWSSYSNLLAPNGGPSCFDPKTLNWDPMGMKPYGFRWNTATFVYAGEVVTPSQSSAGPDGNGHTYQAQNTGWTSLTVEPAWPLTEGGTVVEANAGAGRTPVTWKEITMVVANRVPAPAAPVLALAPGAGTFAAGQKVAVLLTFVNGMGETVAGAVATITTTALNDGVTVNLPALLALAGWLSQLVSPYAITGVNVYETDVISGNPTPAPSTFRLAFANQALGGAVTILATAGGANPPLSNSARITPGQLPTPTSGPVLTRVPAGGTFAAGRDVWVRMSYANANGETPLGPSSSILNTLLNDAVEVTLTALDGFPQLDTINVYEADVATGAIEPDVTQYRLVQSSSVPGTVTISDTATGVGPVFVNGTGPGGNVTADTETGGPNATQGYRYAVPMWVNRNQTYSGFTRAAANASKYIVDEDGWEIAVFNVPIGPTNIIGRIINWTVADSTPAGPWNWIGNVNIQIPTVNIVYPKTFVSGGVTISSTVLLDNTTTSATFNFDDTYLSQANNTTDRLRVQGPPNGVRIDYMRNSDRMMIFGVPGYNGPWVSLGGSDYESFYSDTAVIPIRAAQGMKVWGSIFYRNQSWYMAERSCGVITPGTGDPSSWDVQERWNEVGPCGPRAFDANGDVIMFVHRTGLYKYDGNGKPDLMSKEIPRMWAAINWAAAQCISVTIDDDTHTVRIQVPVFNSTAPNMEFCLSYIEGWLNPIHFSTYAAKEVSQEAARRWSFNDVSSYICRRIYRTVPNPPPQPLSPDGTLQTTSEFYISQLAYTSAIADGLVNARTPGRYDDNGGGIDWVCQSVSAQAMQKPSKPEGVVTSAIGVGPIMVGFLNGRKRMDNRGDQGDVIWVRDTMDLTTDGRVDYTRKPTRQLGEYWSVVYTNSKQPGVWASVKKFTAYIIPVKVARGVIEGTK